ncbi:MAG: phage major capsid protein, partial [Candidatus Nanopelagicales bacterium]
AEGAAKYVANPSATTLTMTPVKVACIVPVSQEFAESNPGGLYDMLKEKAGEALARAFDVAALHGVKIVGGTTGPFATYINQTTAEIVLGTATAANGGLDGDLIGGQGNISNFNGYCLDSTVRARLSNVRDSTGRRLYDNLSSIGSVRAVYGTAVHRGALAAAGWGGDWTQCAYGIGRDITIKMSDQASIMIGESAVSMFQTNQIAVLVEASYGFVANDVPGNFVRFAEATPVLSSIAPTTATASTPTVITLTGTGFLPGTTGDMDGTPLTTTYVSSTTLKITVNTTAGAKAITASTGTLESGSKTLTVS